MFLRWWKKIQSGFSQWPRMALSLIILISSSPGVLAAPAPGPRDGRPMDRISRPLLAPAPTPALAVSNRAGADTGAPVMPDPADDPTLGSLLGRVVNAPDELALAGVQVVAEGVLDSFPLPVYLPLLLARSAAGTAVIGTPASTIRVRAMPASLESFSPLGETVIFTTTTDALGNYLFAIPAGDYTLTFSHAGYTPDERSRPVRANEVLRLDDVRLHPQDPVVTQLGSGGGLAQNSLGNSSLVFPAGALASQEAVRVTYVANPDLPGFFPDGSAPMGFSSFEPAGEVFPAGKEVLWTVAYTGTLPVGTDTLCYWWDGEEQRWRDPVPGKVVDLGGGKKALQAKVPHFSFYGHAVPGIAGQQPGQAGDPTVTTANAGQGPSGFT